MTLQQLVLLSYMDKENKILPENINLRNLGIIKDEDKTTTSNIPTVTNKETKTP